MSANFAHPFADFFARNGLIVSADPLLPTAGFGEPEANRDEKPYGDGAGRGRRSRKAA